LLEFDKFRSLDQSENNVLGIDSKLLNAIADYSSQIENAKNKANELAESWLEAFGFVHDAETSTWNIENNVESISKFVYSIIKTFTPLNAALELIEFWVDNIKKLFEALKKVIDSIDGAYLNKYINFGKGVISNIGKIFGFSQGGLPDKGTMFVAGEAGAEMVYNMPSGQSGVANVRQIEQAMYNALVRYGEQGGDQITIQAYLDGEKVYENTTARAKSRGNVWAKA
jgi:hypothetical protein